MRGAAVPIVDAAPDTVWLWSDLHLGDPGVLRTGRRPFWTTGEMDDHLLDAWRRQVRPEDLLVTLGDVAHPAPWAHPPTVAALRNCPGRRILVLGNHDVADRERQRLRGAGFVEQHAAVLLATAPPLALTHVPLRRVPPTAVNVHGHLHGHPGPAGRYVNLSVEKTGYVPLRLDEVLKEAVRKR